MSRTSASFVTRSPPTGVSMSTLFSLPSLSFFTLTLQPGKASNVPITRVKANHELSLSRLSVRMLRSFLCELWRPLDSGATLGDVGNADREGAAKGGIAQ